MNAECDIEEAWVHSDTPRQMFFNLSDSLVKVPSSETSITFSIRRNTDLTALAPEFKITEGARIEPASGSVHDFSQGPVTYTVTSEDGQWTRIYNVSFKERTRTVNDTVKFDFENFEVRKNESGKDLYYQWFETEDGKREDVWATGNPGFYLAYSTAYDPSIYPTTPLPEGFEGYGMKLETRSTGAFGAMTNKRIAAGNLFYGYFDTKYALTESLKATNFGLPFDKEPVKFTGYYQYKPGPEYQDKTGNYVNRKDQGSIYSVLYRNHDDDGNPVMLYGDNVLTSPQIVAMARVTDVTETTGGWKEFSVDFNYFKPVDIDMLDNFEYNLAIVFSSSYEGEKFEGAVGSTLLIDKVRIICKKTE